MMIRFKKNNMKKPICVFMISALAVLAFSGCGKKDDESKNAASTTTSNNTQESQVTEPVTDESTPAPTEEAATPTPTPRPAVGVDTLSLYIDNGELARRDKAPSVYESTWTLGNDILSLEAIASTDENIDNEGRQFMYIWSSFWDTFDNRDLCKIGYFVSFDLKDGTHIEKTLLSPADTESYFNYLENYLYDDINQVPGQWYSHITEDQMTPDSILTSIKFTPGQDIDKVGDTITCTAFIYTSNEDFDENGHYIGSVSYTVVLKNK